MAQSPRPQRHPSFAGLIGAARADITPPFGIYCRNWGAAKHDVANGLHRPLQVAVLTIQATENDSPLVLASLDLGWFKTNEDEWLVRGGLLDALDLDPARVMLNLSHTHSAPVICREDADKPGGDLIESFLGKVLVALIDSTKEALSNRQPATLDWAYGKCDLATNRDLHDPEKNRIICGYNPGKPTDDTLLVGRATDADGHIIATIVNYACHPTTLAWEVDVISPDYIGAMREVIEQHTHGAPCLFLQGASGEVSPKEQYTVPVETCDAHGRKLGYATLATLEGMLPPRTQLTYAGVMESGAPLATWKRELYAPSTKLSATQIIAKLPLKPDLPSMAQIDESIAQCTDRTMMERLARKRKVRRIVGDGPTAENPLWLWRLGDVFIVAERQEAYTWLQMELRRKFPHTAVAVMNVTNGALGYLPPAELYNEDIYQVWQTPFDRGSLEITEQAATAGLKALAQE